MWLSKVPVKVGRQSRRLRLEIKVGKNSSNSGSTNIALEVMYFTVHCIISTESF